MGVSTDGQICFGILFDEGFEFPWDSNEFEGDIEGWWTFDVLEFRHSFEIFTPEGEYLGGERPPEERITEYFRERREFTERNPELPVELVNCCSGDCPMYILAIPKTCYSASRGYPEELDPQKLTVTA